MDPTEITEKERLSREDAAARLRAAQPTTLARHNEVEFDRGGLRFKVHVPDEVDFKFEIEIDEDECEIELKCDRTHSATRDETRRTIRSTTSFGTMLISSSCG